MSRPIPERSSSFARSFFQAGQDAIDVGDAGGEAVDPEALVTPSPAVNGDLPGVGMRRQRSRRRMSGRESRSGGAMAAAAAAALQADEEEPGHNANGNHNQATNETEAIPPATEQGRQSSWYNDAMKQGGGEDLSAILGQVQDDTAAAAAEQPRSDEDEVLEQYKIMAQFEASLRVTDNTGFDMAEYEKRRKLQPEPEKTEYYTGSSTPKPRLPEPRPIHSATGGASSSTKPEEPPLPPPRPNRRFLDPSRTRSVPELMMGTVVRGQPHLPPGEHFVRCLGCKTRLSVDLQASLVSCPDCSTVSPASSTRR